MALKSILVHVTNSEESVARVESALALAMTHDAHLTVIGVRPVVQIPGYASTNIPDGAIQEVEARQDAAISRRATPFGMRRRGRVGPTAAIGCLARADRRRLSACTFVTPV